MGKTPALPANFAFPKGFKPPSMRSNKRSAGACPSSETLPKRSKKDCEVQMTDSPQVQSSSVKETEVPEVTAPDHLTSVFNFTMKATAMKDPANIDSLSKVARAARLTDCLSLVSTLFCFNFN